MSTHDVLVLFVATGVLLAVARAFGEIAAKAGQPQLIGELVAGIVLGPTLLGHVAPDTATWLFPVTGPVRGAFDALSNLAFVGWLLVAGMNVELPLMLRRAQSAGAIAVCGIVVPSALALAVSYVSPGAFGANPSQDGTPFALFMAAALSISAFPLIARTLVELSMYRTEMGMMTVGAAMADDIAGWLGFALIGGARHRTLHRGHAALLALETIAFVVVTLSAGRWGIRRAFALFDRWTSEASGACGFAFAAVLLGAAFTEWIGVGVALGAFIVGIALAGSERLKTLVYEPSRPFIVSILTPLFFGGIALRVDVVKEWSWPVVVAVLLVACSGKVFGCLLGARWVGLSWRDAWLVGFGMNSRGGMEIMLGGIGLKEGLIGEKTFVALVAMAIVTSMSSGSIMICIAGTSEVRGSKGAKAVASEGVGSPASS